MTSQDLLNPRNARVLLCLALAGSGALLIAWQSHLTFLIDDWDLLLLRRGFNADVLLDPHARHLIVGPALEYKAIQATLGMDSHLPYGAVATGSFLASVALLYVYVRRRVGDWVALAAVLPILVMGSAYEDLLSAFQIGYFGSMAFGIGALLVIERADRRGDAFACALLVASLAFAEIALAFAAGVAVAIALQRGPLRRAWVVAVPILLYAAWYPTFGQSGAHLGPSGFSLHNVANTPPYVLDGFASSAGSLLGFGTPLLFGGNGGLEWGRPILLALGVISIAWLVRARPANRWWVLVPLAIGVSFWFLTGSELRLRPHPQRLALPVRRCGLSGDDRRAARRRVAARRARGDRGPRRESRRGGSATSARCATATTASPASRLWCAAGSPASTSQRTARARTSC